MVEAMMIETGSEWVWLTSESVSASCASDLSREATVLLRFKYFWKS